jgi:hypothetical protein
MRIIRDLGALFAIALIAFIPLSILYITVFA